MTALTEPTFDTVSETNGWFEKTINELETDKLLYNANAMSAEKAKFYENLAKGPGKQLFDSIVNLAHEFYVKELLVEFVKHLIERKGSLPQLVAFDYKDREIMAWVQVKDDDEDLMDHIFIGEAIINNNYTPSGYGISATIVEQSDEIKKPKHYKSIDLNKIIGNSTRKKR